MPLRHRKLCIEPLEDRRVLATIVVDSLNDNTNAGDGLTTLREALAEADDNDIVEFAPELFSDGQQTLLLTEGVLDIDPSLTIRGPGAELLTIDASGNDFTPGVADGQGTGVFRVHDSGFFDAPVTISGMTLTGGDTGLRGGAIWAEDPLTLEDSVVVGNNASQNGGAIYSEKALTLTRSTIDSNESRAFGGGVYALDRITMTDSNVIGNKSRLAGGGIYITDSFLTVDGGEISHNQNLTLEDGGGVYSRNTISNVTGATFVGNRSMREGGAFYQYNGRLTATSTSFDRNHAESGNGGAIYATLGVGLTLSDASVSNNTALVQGGGLYANFVTVVDVDDTTVVGNSAGSLGGGIYVKNLSSNLFVSGSDIRDNTADSWGGGIMADEQAGVQVDTTSIVENHANLGGGMYAYRADFATLIDSTLVGNTASEGGGLLAREMQGRLTLTRSTLSGNLAAGNGAGILATDVDVFLRQSTVTRNRADSDQNADGSGGGVFASDGAHINLLGSILADNADDGTGPDLELFPSFEDPTVFASYSLLGDNTGSGRPEAAPDSLANLIGGPVGGAIDPRLGPLADHGGPTMTHALLPDSPAIDAGDPSIVFDPNKFDQRGEGFFRVANGDDTGDVAIDIGAFELQAPPLGFPVGDYNQDGIANLADYTKWRDTLGSTTDLAADGDGDEIIGPGDYDVWKQNFGNTTIPLAHGSTSALQVANDLAFATYGGLNTQLKNIESTPPIVEPRSTETSSGHDQLLLLDQIVASRAAQQSDLEDNLVSASRQPNSDVPDFPTLLDEWTW